MSLYDDGAEHNRRIKSTYADEVNRRIKELEAENSYLSAKIQTKVINKRSGSVRIKTLYQVNEDRRKACIQKFWIRGSRSNSIGFEFHAVQNMPQTTESGERRILLSTQLVRG